MGVRFDSEQQRFVFDFEHDGQDDIVSLTGEGNHAGGNDVRGMRLSALGSPYRFAEHGLHSRRSLRPAPHQRLVVK